MEKNTPHYSLVEIQYNGAALYIKFQRAGDYFVVSFKEL